MYDREFRKNAQIFVDTAKQIDGVELKYNEESVLKMDQIISKNWPEQPPVQLDSVVIPMGSFLGEVIRVTIGGEWVNNQQGWGVKIDDSTMMVFSKVKKRFLNGMGDSISYYYQSLKKILNEK